MLSKVTSIVRRVKFQSWSKPGPWNLTRPILVPHAKRFSTNMYCMQCEQTSHGTGCTAQGICGKWPETANMQDLLVYVNNGLAQYIHHMGQHTLDTSLKEKARFHIMESMFSTVTNVNFSEERMVEYIEQTLAIRDEIKPIFRQIHPDKQEFELIENNPCNYSIQDSENLNADALNLASLHATKQRIGDANCFGLRECAVYGLKGMMAYFQHAEYMHKSSANGVYSEQERDDIYSMAFAMMNDLCSNSKELNYWLDMCMRIGTANIQILEILDRSHNILYGTPEPTNVSSTPIHGKCILMSGHDILEVKKVLELIEKKQLDINVYTHGELLPVHSYPEFKKYKNFVGHFGQAWQNQYKDFKAFPGPIVMTSNCLMPPRTRYKDRLFTVHCMGYDDIKHIDSDNEIELELILNKAMECDGFNDGSIEKFKDAKPHVIGYGHAAVLAQADVVIDALKSGDLQHIFVIGGCDGTEKTRSYFTDLAQVTPDNSMILTLGCGKFRLHGLELGDIGDSGIPRVLDVGQCNDAYSAVVIALKLAEALDTDIHHLPLHFAISWFEQKAVSVFLSLLSLGVRNIRLGPALPAFLTEDVRKYLFDNLGVRQVALKDMNEDMQQMLAETPQTAMN